MRSVGRGAVLYDVRPPKKRPCCSRGGRCLAHVRGVYEETATGEVYYKIADGTHTTRERVHEGDLEYGFEPAGWSVHTVEKPTYILTRHHGVEDHHDLMTDGGLGDFGVDVPEPEEPREPDTSEDYKFSRPQCRALTDDGDRCSNPTVRGRDTPFCPAHDELDDVETIDDSDDDPADALGVECDVAGCEARIVGLDDGWEYDRGTVCQNCIDYNRRHGHWPDEERDPCVECMIDDGCVRHECDECQFDTVILEPPTTCEYCGEEVDDAA